jgi:hypothetical protein
MKKLPVDLAELQLALEDYDGGLGLHTYWFDRQTGEVIFLTEDLEEQDELRERIEEDTDDRFVQIEPIDSHDGFRIMHDFVETMQPSRLREKLGWSETFSTLQGCTVREQGRAKTVAQVS